MSRIGAYFGDVLMDTPGVRQVTGWQAERLLQQVPQAAWPEVDCNDRALRQVLPTTTPFLVSSIVTGMTTVPWIGARVIENPALDPRIVLGEIAAWAVGVVVLGGIADQVWEWGRNTGLRHNIQSGENLIASAKILAARDKDTAVSDLQKIVNDKKFLGERDDTTIREAFRALMQIDFDAALRAIDAAKRRLDAGGPVALGEDKLGRLQILAAEMAAFLPANKFNKILRYGNNFKTSGNEITAFGFKDGVSKDLVGTAAIVRDNLPQDKQARFEVLLRTAAAVDLLKTWDKDSIEAEAVVGNYVNSILSGGEAAFQTAVETLLEILTHDRSATNHSVIIALLEELCDFAYFRGDTNSTVD